MIDKYTSWANMFHKYTGISFNVEGHGENGN